MNKLIAALLASAFAATAHADVRITEWMYSGGSGEFIEFTNLGSSAIDFTGWSYDDDSRTVGVFDLSGFGMVAAGETVVITEQEDIALFRLDWSLADSVTVLGGYTNNIGRSDEINLFDAAGNLVDRLTYGDNTVGGPRTQNASGRADSVAALGANDATQWVLSTVGDVEGSYASLSGAVGSPGKTSFATAVPEPETYAMLLAGLGLVGLVARRRAR